MFTGLITSIARQCTKSVQRDFRKQAVADIDLVIERLAIDKARELKVIQAAIAAAAAEE